MIAKKALALGLVLRQRRERGRQRDRTNNCAGQRSVARIKVCTCTCGCAVISVAVTHTLERLPRSPRVLHVKRGRRHRPVPPRHEPLRTPLRLRQGGATGRRPPRRGYLVQRRDALPEPLVLRSTPPLAHRWL